MSIVGGRPAAPGRLVLPALDGLSRVLTRIGVGGAVTGGVALTTLALALGAQSGSRLGANTIAQVLLVVAGLGLVVAALCVPSGRVVRVPLHGAWALAGVAGIAFITALSIIWSLDPNASWVETNRTLSYLSVFAGGLSLARLAPGRWAALLRGVALGSVLVSAWALATKVLPGVIAPDEIFARLRAPFDYWNATGLMAALGVPPLVWLGARRSGHAAANALAFPGLGIVTSALMLSYSRGALLALVLGMVLWFAAVPLRLRGMVVLLLPALATAGVVAWAFGQPALTENSADPAAQADAGLALGLLLILQFVVLLGLGLLIGYTRSLHTPSPRQRLLAGRAAVGVLAAILATGIVALATAPGGIGGQVSNAVETVTSSDAPTPRNDPSRLTATSSVRARYWAEAFDVHALSPWIGAGTGAYETARKRFRSGDYDVAHAHGYVPQVLSDVGWVGLAVSVFALVAWFVAAVRAVGLRRKDRGLPWDAERVGVFTLMVVALMFGMHSAVDWTWFIPATSCLGLFCAAWVVGRGPLRARIEQEGPTGMVRAAERVGMVPARPAQGFKAVVANWRPSPARFAVAVCVVAAGVATTWAIVQPLRSANAGDVSLALLDAGRPTNAADTALVAVDRNPLAVDPWFDLATARQAMGDEAGARAAFERAVRVQPANAEAWTSLGQFLVSQNDLQGALRPFQVAYFLDPQSPLVRANLTRVTRALRS